MKNSAKIAMVALSSFVIIASAAYAGLWYMQARTAKTQIVSAISRINAGHDYVTYENISLHGFPGKVAVRIEKPTFHFPVKEVLQPLGQQMAPAPDGTPQANLRKIFLDLPDWSETITLAGNMDIGVNMLSNSYSTTISGDYQLESTINGTTQHLTYHSEGERECQLSFNRPKLSEFSLWSLEYLSKNPEQVFASLNTFSCKLPVANLKLEDGTVAYQSKANQLSLDVDRSGDVDIYKAHIAMPEFEAAPSFDTLVESYYQAIFTEQPLPTKYKMSGLGKQQFAFDGALSVNPKNPQAAPVAIKIDDFSYITDLGETKLTSDIKITPKNQFGNASWDIHLSNNANEKAYERYKLQAHELANELYDKMAAAQKELPMDRETYASQFELLVPHVDELGTLNVNLAGNAEMNEQQRLNFEVEAMEASVSPYGVNLTGKGEMASPIVPIPQGEFQLACRSCEALVDDVSQWFAHLLPLMKMTVAENEMSSNVNSHLIEGIKKFMHLLDPGATGDFHFRLVMDGKSEPQVNGKTLTEVMSMYQEHVGQFLRADQTIDLTSGAPTEQAAPAEPVISEEVKTPEPVATAPEEQPKAEPADNMKITSEQEKISKTTSVEPAKKEAVAAKDQAKTDISKAEAAPKTATKPLANMPAKRKPVSKTSGKIEPLPPVDMVLPGQGAVQ